MLKLNKCSSAVILIWRRALPSKLKACYVSDFETYWNSTRLILFPFPTFPWNGKITWSSVQSSGRLYSSLLIGWKGSAGHKMSSLFPIKSLTISGKHNPILPQISQKRTSNWKCSKMPDNRRSSNLSVARLNSPPSALLPRGNSQANAARLMPPDAAKWEGWHGWLPRATADKCYSSVPWLHTYGGIHRTWLILLTTNLVI